MLLRDNLNNMLFWCNVCGEYHSSYFRKDLFGYYQPIQLIINTLTLIRIKITKL